MESPPGGNLYGLDGKLKDPAEFLPKDPSTPNENQEPDPEENPVQVDLDNIPQTLKDLGDLLGYWRSKREGKSPSYAERSVHKLISAVEKYQNLADANKSETTLDAAIQEIQEIANVYTQAVLGDSEKEGLNEEQMAKGPEGLSGPGDEQNVSDQKPSFDKPFDLKKGEQMEQVLQHLEGEIGADEDAQRAANIMRHTPQGEVNDALYKKILAYDKLSARSGQKGIKAERKQAEEAIEAIRAERQALLQKMEERDQLASSINPEDATRREQLEKEIQEIGDRYAAEADAQEAEERERIKAEREARKQARREARDRQTPVPDQVEPDPSVVLPGGQDANNIDDPLVRAAAARAQATPAEPIVATAPDTNTDDSTKSGATGSDKKRNTRKTGRTRKAPASRVKTGGDTKGPKIKDVQTGDGSPIIIGNNNTVTKEEKNTTLNLEGTGHNVQIGDRNVTIQGIPLAPLMSVRGDVMQGKVFQTSTPLTSTPGPTFSITPEGTQPPSATPNNAPTPQSPAGPTRGQSILWQSPGGNTLLTIVDNPFRGADGLEYVRVSDAAGNQTVMRVGDLSANPPTPKKPTVEMTGADLGIPIKPAPKKKAGTLHMGGDGVIGSPSVHIGDTPMGDTNPDVTFTYTPSEPLPGGRIVTTNISGAPATPPAPGEPNAAPSGPRTGAKLLEEMYGSVEAQKWLKNLAAARDQVSLEEGLWRRTKRSVVNAFAGGLNAELRKARRQEQDTEKNYLGFFAQKNQEAFEKDRARIQAAYAKAEEVFNKSAKSPEDKKKLESRKQKIGALETRSRGQLTQLTVQKNHKVISDERLRLVQERIDKTPKYKKALQNALAFYGKVPLTGRIAIGAGLAAGAALTLTGVPVLLAAGASVGATGASTLTGWIGSKLAERGQKKRAAKAEKQTADRLKKLSDKEKAGTVSTLEDSKQILDLALQQDKKNERAVRRGKRIKIISQMAVAAGTAAGIAGLPKWTGLDSSAVPPTGPGAGIATPPSGAGPRFPNDPGYIPPPDAPARPQFPDDPGYNPGPVDADRPEGEIGLAEPSDQAFPNETLDKGKDYSIFTGGTPKDQPMPLAKEVITPQDRIGAGAEGEITPRERGALSEDEIIGEGADGYPPATPPYTPPPFGPRVMPAPEPSTPSTPIPEPPTTPEPPRAPAPVDPSVVTPPRTPNAFGEVHTVKPGDNLWNIIGEKLQKSGQFDGLSQAQKNAMIQGYEDQLAKLGPKGLKELGFGSGDMNKIYPGEKLDLELLDRTRINAEPSLANKPAAAVTGPRVTTPVTGPTQQVAYTGDVSPTAPVPSPTQINTELSNIVHNNLGRKGIFNFLDRIGSSDPAFERFDKYVSWRSPSHFMEARGDMGALDANDVVKLRATLLEGQSYGINVRGIATMKEALEQIARARLSRGA